MSFANLTSYSAIDVPLPDHHGQDMVVAIVKATFKVTANGKVSPAEPIPIRFTDVMRDADAPDSSIKLPSDICVQKWGSDVVIVGDAISPKSVEFLDIAVKIRERSVPLRVHGQRVFCQSAFGVGISPTIPFRRMPVIYEKAYGGVTEDISEAELRNPVGVGVALKAKDLIDKPAPQIEHPAHPYTSARDKHEPVGFGAIASHWGPRRDFFGTCNPAWEESRMPLPPLDFDLRYNNVAHPSLQFGEALQAGEMISILGMCEADSGLFSFALPDLNIRVQAMFDNAPMETIVPAIDTVIVQPNLGVVEIATRAAFPAGRGKKVLRELRVEHLKLGTWVFYKMNAFGNFRLFG
jgi:hypothetical protein